MHRTSRYLVGLALLAGSLGSLHAQPEFPTPREVPVATPEIPAPFSVDSLRESIRFLAGDLLAGRRTGTKENLEAAKYIADKFRAAGLVPLSGGDGYFHTFEYLAGAENGSGNALTISGPGGAPVAAVMGKDFFPLSFSASASLDAPVAFAGYGISAKDQNYDDYAGIDARGKIVVVMRFSPEGNNPHGAFARHAAIAAKVATARDHGAAGIIFINPPLDSAAMLAGSFDRSFTNAGIPAITVRDGMFDAVRDPKGRSLTAVQKAIDSLRAPASFVPAGYTAKLVTDVRLRREQVPNVVGVLPGSDPKLRDEFIVVGGHFDHLGWGGEGSLHGGKDPAIHHGADDNASGTAGVMALAQYWSGMTSMRHKRSIIFIAFNGEEEGLLGSAALVASPSFPTDKVVAMINMDMIGRLDSVNLIVQGTGTSPSWKDLLDRTNGVRFNLKKVEDGFGPSDHSSFYSKGIPVLFFFTGLHSDYHRPSDVWEKINYEGESRVLQYVADVMGVIDASAERPPFTKTQSSAERSSSGFSVYVGTIPDYAYDGKGLRLTGVAEGGPAQRAGLKEGDIIMRMGEKGINNIYDYTYALGEFKPKQIVEVEFIRDDKTMTAKVEMGRR